RAGPRAAWPECGRLEDGASFAPGDRASDLGRLGNSPRSPSEARAPPGDRSNYSTNAALGELGQPSRHASKSDLHVAAPSLAAATQSCMQAPRPLPGLQPSAQSFLSPTRSFVHAARFLPQVPKQSLDEGCPGPVGGWQLSIHPV